MGFLRAPFAATMIGASMIVFPAGAEDDVAKFYAGRTIQIIVGTSAGGGYDAYARTMARHMGRHLAGNPLFIVSNMPGAGSNLMSAHVAAVAPKDGSVIGASFSTQPLAAVFEEPARLRFDPRRLHYLGSATTDDYVCVIRPDAPATRLTEMLKTQVVLGGTAETGATGYLPILLNNTIGSRFKVVFGYPGSREIIGAIERNELHGMCGLNISSINAQYAHLLKEQKIKVFAQESVKGHPVFNDMGVPRTLDLAKTDEQKAILEIVYSQGTFARPYFVAHETPPDRVRALRRAFFDTWKDTEVLQEMKKMRHEVEPTSGEDMEQMLVRIYASPPEILEKTRRAIRLK